jgi:hypothetical protein
VPEVEGLQAGIDRLGALEVQHGREDAVGERGVEVARRAGEAHVAVAVQTGQPPGGARRERVGDVRPDRRARLDPHAAVRLGLEGRVVAGRRGEHGEDASGQAARACARQVEVPARAPRDEVGGVLAGQGVVVAVEDGDRGPGTARRAAAHSSSW